MGKNKDTFFDKQQTGGRPLLVLNQAGIDLVQALGRLQCTNEEIASCLGTTDTTLLNAQNKEVFFLSNLHFYLFFIYSLKSIGWWRSKNLCLNLVHMIYHNAAKVLCNSLKGLRGGYSFLTISLFHGLVKKRR